MKTIIYKTILVKTSKSGFCYVSVPKNLTPEEEKAYITKQLGRAIKEWEYAQKTSTI